MLALLPIDYTVAQNNFAATPSSTAPGTTVTTGGVAHTKTAWTQVFSATNFDVNELDVLVVGTSSAGVQTDALLDIGIGAAASEVVIVPDILAGWRQSLVSAVVSGGFRIPVTIPASTRVAIRAQSLETSKAVNVVIVARGGASQPATGLYAGIDAIGIVAASSQGTSHTAGNSGSFSSWTNFGSVTTRDYRAVLMLAQGNMAVNTLNNLAYQFEWGVSSTTFGAALFSTSTTESSWGPFPNQPVRQFVPSGSQLQVRGKCSGTAQALDVALYGFY
jgi:hypothetical protein